MGRRYFYWRGPEGRPAPGRGALVPRQILSELGESARISPEGNITWQGMLMFPLESALRSLAMIVDERGEELNEDDTWSLVWRAMLSVIKCDGGGRPIDPDKLTKAADSLAAAHFRLPRVGFVLRTSLSVETLPARRVRAGECVIEACPQHRYRLPDPLPGVPLASALEQHVESSQYKRICIRTTARTVAEAVSSGLQSLDLLRGLWNLFATRNSVSFSMGGTELKPLGVVHRGPIHLVYRGNGALADDAIWVDRDFVGERPLFKPRSGWHAIEKQRRWAMRRLAHLPYGPELTQVIVRYANALDYRDLSVSVLQLWGLLEKITGTIGTAYEKTVRRATRVYSDGALARDVLNSVRLRRNQWVHAARGATDPDMVAQLVKSFVDPHLVALLKNDASNRTLEDYVRQLDLPTSRETLLQTRRQIATALRRVESAARPPQQT